MSEATTHLLTLCEPDASDQRAVMLTRMLDSYDYSRAELMLAMREVPRDPEASHNYGGGFNLADVHRVIEKNRQMRARLKQALTRKARDELLTEYPETLDGDDFKCCGFNEHDKPLYRYAPNVKSHAGPPRAELDVDDLPGADRTEGTTGGPKRLGDTISEQRKSA